MDEQTRKQIGIRLRNKREAAGYSREALGELCGLSPRFIANIEFGESTFSMDSLMKACRALSCSSDYLLFGEPPAVDGWDDTIEKLSSMDPVYKEGMNKIVNAVNELVIRAEKNKEN